MWYIDWFRYAWLKWLQILSYSKVLSHSKTTGLLDFTDRAAMPGRQTVVYILIWWWVCWLVAFYWHDKQHKLDNTKMQTIFLKPMQYYTDKHWSNTDGDPSGVSFRLTLSPAWRRNRLSPACRHSRQSRRPRTGKASSAGKSSILIINS